MVFSKQLVLINLQKCCCHNKYQSTYKRNISRREGNFQGFWIPTHKQRQDEPPPPYPQHLCPILPWQHPPWPQIMVPWLPMSLLKAPSGGFAINVAGSFAWGAKTDPSIGGPQEKMPCFPISPGPILSSPIHLNSSQYVPCTVWLKTIDHFLTCGAAKVHIFGVTHDWPSYCRNGTSSTCKVLFHGWFKIHFEALKLFPCTSDRCLCSIGALFQHHVVCGCY